MVEYDREDEDEDEDELTSEGQPRGRALLLESQAEELRERLDALLAELAHHRRGGNVDLRRYVVPAALAFVLATTGIVSLVSWRRHRRAESWSHLGVRARARLSRLLWS
jgi:hypothetical protein